MNFIDLGLPSGSLWADCNVGAEKPEDYGEYFSFDEAQKQGKVPARWQFCELQDCCQIENDKLNNVPGIKITGPNGKYIFLPFSGYRSYSSGALNSVASYGYYWSSCQYSSSSYGWQILYTNGTSYFNPSNYYRALGFTVRLVKNKE